MKTKNILLLVIIGSFLLLALNQTGVLRISTTSYIGPYTGAGAAPSGNPTIYCAQSSGLAQLSSPPTNCFNYPLILKILPTDLYAQAALAASTYSVKFWIYTAQGWQPTGDIVACGAAPTSCTSSLSYNPGSQIGVSLCKNQTPSCTSVDYSAQKLRMDCLLPSATATAIAGGVCGQNGLGAGYVPFSGPCSSVPCTQSFTMPVVLTPGAAYANNSPDQIQWTVQNGTTYTSTGICGVSTSADAKNCDSPKATSTGRVSFNVQVQTGAAGGTAPAAPYGAGCTTFTPFDPALQNLAVPGQNRGALTCAWVQEIKQTAGAGMCVPTSPVTVGGVAIQPQVIPNGGNSATDIFYVYLLPDSALLRSVDPAGNVLSQGSIQTQLSFDCSRVYNNAGSTVTITNNIYGYFSLNYFRNNYGTNTEVPINSSSGIATNFVLTVNT